MELPTVSDLSTKVWRLDLTRLRTLYECTAARAVCEHITYTSKHQQHVQVCIYHVHVLTSSRAVCEHIAPTCARLSFFSIHMIYTLRIQKYVIQDKSPLSRWYSVPVQLDSVGRDIYFVS